MASAKMSREQLRDIKQEEIRGLFVLGLLAVLASVRIQYGTMPLAIGGASYDVVLFLDSTIVLWSFYALFMVFGFSADMIGESTSKICRDIAKLFLQFNFIALFGLGLIFGFSAYPTRMPWVLGLVAIFLGLRLFNRFQNRRKSPIKLNLRESLKSNKSPILILILSFSIIFIMFGSSEYYTLPSFIIGCLVIVSLFLISLKTKKEFNGER